MATYEQTAVILGTATATVWEETAPDTFFTVYRNEGIKVRFSPEYGDWTITSTATYPDIRMNLGDAVAAVQEVIRTFSATV